MLTAQELRIIQAEILLNQVASELNEQKTKLFNNMERRKDDPQKVEQLISDLSEILKR